jgi:phospholipase/lecithinase/hemolysin
MINAQEATHKLQSGWSLVKVAEYFRPTRDTADTDESYTLKLTLWREGLKYIWTEPTVRRRNLSERAAEIKAELAEVKAAAQELLKKIAAAKAQKPEEGSK